jgi:hypothetical protein
MRRKPSAANLIHFPGDLVMTSIASFREIIGRPRVDDGIMREYRQRLADEQFERAELKRKDVADQRSELNDAKARIQAWEKVHALRLPTSPTHPILRLIAATTELALKDILDEQRKRSGQIRAAQPE